MSGLDLKRGPKLRRVLADHRTFDIAAYAEPGEHILTCELLNVTADPGGGKEFRIISVMR